MSSSSRIIMDDELYKAARGDVEGIPPNTMDDVLFKSRTPGVEMNNVLHVAAQHGNEGFIRQALEHYQSYVCDLLCEHNSKGENPLHLAAKFGQAEVVKALIDAHDHTEKPCWREIDKHGDTPLHMALKFGQQDIAILLVQRDVNLVSLDNKAGDSPAYIAAENLCERFLRTILDTEHYDQSSVSFSGPSGMTVFHAARNLNDNIMLDLMERRKELLKHQDNKGKTVLHYAVEDNIEPMVDILLKADSSLGFLHDNDGMTPLHIASSMGSFPMVRAILELSPQSISMICENGDHAGKTALHVAKMDTSFLKVCLRHTNMKKLINVGDNEGNTLLHLALKHNSSLQDVADALLEVGGVNWRLKNNDGCTPMDLCKSHHQIPSTNLLVSREEISGINGELENIDVSTPINLSKSGDNIPSNLKRLTSEYWRSVNDEINTQIHQPTWDCLDQLSTNSDIKWEKVFTTDSVQERESMIHLAARLGRMEIIIKACEWNCESRIMLLSAENSKAETPLHLAAAAGELEVVILILILSKSTDKLGNMKKARQQEQLRVVIEHTQPAPDDQDDMENISDWEYWKPWRMKSAKGDTPLHMALRNGYEQVAICLFKWDPQLIFSTVNKLNESLLYLAASTGCCKAIEDHILPESSGDESYTSRINMISNNGPRGQNALHALILHFQDYSAKEVISAPSFDFHKPSVKKINLGKMLNRNSAALPVIKRMPHDLVNYVDNDGKTPLHYAVEHGGDPEILFLLLCMDKNRTATPLMYDNEGFTPLLRAVANGYEKCASILKAFCSPSIELRHAGNGRTVLHFLKVTFPSADSDYFRETKLINQTDNDGNTPLHCAVLESDMYKTRFLLTIKGVRLSIRNKQHHTPMDLCTQLMTKGDSKQVAIRIALEDAIDKEKGRSSQVPLLVRINTRLMSYSAWKSSNDDIKKLLENLAVAAALLITLTFAATFTIPGGYDQNTGQALRMKEASIKVFVASDVVAMLLGVGVLLMYTFGATKPAWMRGLVIPCVVMIQCALLATIISFISGIYALVFQDAKWIAFLAVAIVGGVLALFFVTPAVAQIVSAFLKWLLNAGKVLLALLFKVPYHLAKICGQEDYIDGLIGRINA